MGFGHMFASGGEKEHPASSFLQKLSRCRPATLRAEIRQRETARHKFDLRQGLSDHSGLAYLAWGSDTTRLEWEAGSGGVKAVRYQSANTEVKAWMKRLLLLV
ncbi:hypothetical protein AJ79_07162 [Helicocarpus griseus UAMH5409]|uniref:Uncharacterized protein n=1 Tax=Helicocarpus griseus UAMH5409 TaxID=1447875 RepID=A0A2B7WXU4_9EURO|nr:hypothetical protein AJ79_07162 [Helicocarpus griseus UAMH5409]